MGREGAARDRKRPLPSPLLLLFCTAPHPSRFFHLQYSEVPHRNFHIFRISVHCADPSEQIFSSKMDPDVLRWSCPGRSPQLQYGGLCRICRRCCLHPCLSTDDFSIGSNRPKPLSDGGFNSCCNCGHAGFRNKCYGHRVGGNLHLFSLLPVSGGGYGGDPPIEFDDSRRIRCPPLQWNHQFPPADVVLSIYQRVPPYFYLHLSFPRHRHSWLLPFGLLSGGLNFILVVLSPL